LNIPEEALGPLQPQVVSTGLRDILVQVRDLDTLLSLKPDFDRMSALSKGYRTIGVHAFTLETKFESAAHCRNFAPLYGIPEESATGTSNGALSCYLFKYGVISPAQAKHLIYEQGYSMKKPSEILAKLTIQAGRIKAVQVGGTALVTKALYL
jgi:PhzF family phenazine biosynthesis protein